MRLVESTGNGGTGGFLVGCDGKGLRFNEGGSDDPDAVVEPSTARGDVASRVPANRSKSAKSLMAALGPESENADSPSGSGGDVETGASFSCVAILPGLLIDAAIAGAKSSSAGGVWTGLSAFLNPIEGGGSALDPSTRSANTQPDTFR
jgi:hypothetical protein